MTAERSPVGRSAESCPPASPVASPGLLVSSPEAPREPVPGGPVGSPAGPPGASGGAAAHPCVAQLPPAGWYDRLCRGYAGAGCPLPVAVGSGPTGVERAVPQDRDPYFAFPTLRGAPAYARPPRPVPDPTRPFDPDDMPIAAEQSDEQRAVLRERGLVGRYRQPLAQEAGVPALAGGYLPASPSPPAPVPARRLNLRVFAGRRRIPND